jgi:hypothetical protein
MPKIVGVVLGLLLSAALALSPVAAFADAVGAAMPPDKHSAAMDETPPCDMPCDGCADGSSLQCLIACAGLIAALPAVDVVRRPVVHAYRAPASPKTLLSGREREPDKPPPKLIPA